jgi:hypothetical protein
VESSELERRKLVWVALSEFYLDTELSNDDYQRIARKLMESKYTFHEIKKIDTYEVFPVLHKNLLDTAGEWQGFDEEWLCEQCLDRYKDRKLVLWRIAHITMNLFFAWMKSHHFRKVRKILRKNGDSEQI